MSRTKNGLKHELSRFQTATPEKKSEPFVQIGISLLQHPAFRALNPAAQMLYIDLLAEAKQYREAPLEFTRVMARRYGISKNTLYRRVEELRKAGFLKVESGQPTKEASTYHLSDEWRTKPL